MRVLRYTFFGLLAFACDATDADEGRDATMQVAKAQFFRGAMPAPSGPASVRSATVPPKVEAGSVERSIAGEISKDGTAVAIGLAGDLGYWVLPAGLPSAAATDEPTYLALLSFSPKAAPGAREIVVSAVDAEKRFGPVLIKPIAIVARALPEGELVVSLSWDNRANLDLHVVDPTGAEIFKRDVNSYQSPGPGAPREAPNTPHDGGVLDFDSNAECIPDGRRAENVVWTEAPPKGHYLVRVDTFSLCEEPASRWQVQAFLHGTRIGAAEGISTDVDTTFSHDRGAGVLALEFDVP
jgi:hypothetical protein